jgi:transposase/predicted transcriptional regulator
MPQIVDKNKVKRICVDDFAFKKRYTYGTIMIDIDSHRVIDILNSRDKDKVSEWLKTYPNIEVVSRDGSHTYEAAVKLSHPNAVQVTDRFHLLKNMSEAVEKYMYRLYPSRLEIPATSTTLSPEMETLYNTRNRRERILFARQKYKEGYTQSEVALLLHSAISTVGKYLKMSEEDIPEASSSSRERQHQNEMSKKKAKIDEVKIMFQNGDSIDEICRKTGHTYQTVMNYVSENYSLVNGHYDNRRPGKLQKYEEEVILFRSKGMTYKKITEIIRQKGYTGTVDALRVFMQKEREHQKNAGMQKEESKKEYIARKWMIQLIYHKLDQVKAITGEQYEEVLKKYPTIGIIYNLLRQFHEIIFSKEYSRLDEWMHKANSLGITEIDSYISGLKNDIDAVKNAITEKYNNGLAEGSINKLKVIKRVMYGRNSFELLKAKLLRLELMKIN